MDPTVQPPPPPLFKSLRPLMNTRGSVDVTSDTGLFFFCFVFFKNLFVFVFLLLIND